MNIASTTFFASRDESNLFKATLIPNRVPEALVPDTDTSLALAEQQRVTMETAIAEALRTDQKYPVGQGSLMLNALGWHAGLEELLEHEVDVLKLTYASKATYHLLPELVALPSASDEVDMWLDKKFPIYRTLNHVDQRPVERRKEMSLAILYQDEHPFPDLVEKIENMLLGKLTPNRYKGSNFVNKPGGYSRLVEEVFHRHRAVLFLGHHHRPNGGQGGWQLTSKSDDFLPLSDLHTLLGGAQAGKSHGKSRHSWAMECVPELVFSGCCSGAWGELGHLNQDEIFYPSLFLESGIRFFVGAWMDIQGRWADIDYIPQLIGEFFTLWADDPDHAVQHLYAAKKACDFHLLTSLFQIYARVERAPTAPNRESVQNTEPTSALIQGFLPQDLLGDYHLVAELWTDPYAKTFWAHGENNNYLVQVLVDEWQDNPEIAQGLDTAIEKLTDIELSAGQLIPNRHEFVLWQRGDKAFRHMHILVYDRPASESIGQWSTLTSQHFNPNHPEHFMAVLLLGAQISGLVAELHEKQILYGNLDQNSIVFLEKYGQRHPFLKDAWLRQVRPGRTTEQRYAAPEEPAQFQGDSRFKYDSWGLGIILFELATGQPFGGVLSAEQEPEVSIRQVLGGGQQVPEALERVVQQCLLPQEAVRPSADLVARRLLLAFHAGGNYVSEIEQALHERIQAGHRLFAVVTEGIEAIESVVQGLVEHPRPAVQYHLFVATENDGLRDMRSKRSIVRWVSANELQQIFAAEARQRGLAPRLPTDDEVADLNGGNILDWATTYAPPPGETPLLLIRGSGWWNHFWSSKTARWRVLKFCQQERQQPVIVVADHFFSSTYADEDAPRAFTLLKFPPLSLSDLFERILSAPRTDHLAVPPVTAEVAIGLAERLFPITGRAATNALHMCARQYGVIDERMVEIRDQEQAQVFRHFSAVTYTSPGQLPSLDLVGLPLNLQQQVDHWIMAQVEESITPKRIMISGPSGYGKTLLAKALAQRVRRPVVQIDVGRCLHGRVGESEQALQAALTVAGSLGGAMVLLDDIDRFFGNANSGGANSLASTMARMSSIVLNWLDAMPHSVVAVLTSKDPSVLPIQWRRRVELQWSLDSPAPPDLTDEASLGYRTAIFRGLFRRFNLSELASDYEFMQELARSTHPVIRLTPLLSPTAKRCPATPLGDQTVELKAGVDIESWIADTISLHATHVTQPITHEFWRTAAN
jgi:hypothetical protein